MNKPIRSKQTEEDDAPMSTASLVDRLATPEETGLNLALFVPLLRLLATGDPVEVAALAAASGHTMNDVRRRLAAVPDTEYDDTGRIIGQGLTLRPTAHRFTLEGQELYTWCALDTLIFPALLGRAARVESTSPISGQPVRVSIQPAGLTSVEPATAVVSLLNPEDMSSIRSSFCNQVHYFTSPEDAQPWLQIHAGAEVVPVADAYRLGAALTFRATGRVPADPAATENTIDTNRCCH